MAARDGQAQAYSRARPLAAREWLEQLIDEFVGYAFSLKPAKEHTGEVSTDGPTMTRYLGWVRTALSKLKTTVILATAFFGLALGCIFFINTGFMPAQDKSQSTVSLKLQPGSTLEETAAVSRRAAELLSTLLEVRAVFTSVGTASTGGMGGGSSATVLSPIIVPVVFTYVDDLLQWGSRKIGQWRGISNAAPVVDTQLPTK